MQTQTPNTANPNNQIQATTKKSNNKTNKVQIADHPPKHKRKYPSNNQTTPNQTT